MEGAQDDYQHKSTNGYFSPHTDQRNFKHEYFFSTLYDKSKLLRTDIDNPDEFPTFSGEWKSEDYIPVKYNDLPVLRAALELEYAGLHISYYGADRIVVEDSYSRIYPAGVYYAID